MIFGSKKKTYVFAGNQPMFMEDNAFTFNDNIIFKSLWYEEDAVDHIRNTLFNGDYLNYKQFYKYGKRHYTRGIPKVSFTTKELIGQHDIIKNVWEDYCKRYGFTYSESDFPKDLIWERMPFELVEWSTVTGSDRPPITPEHFKVQLAARLLIDPDMNFSPLNHTITFSDKATNVRWFKKDAVIDHPLRGEEWFLELDTCEEYRTEELMVDVYQPITTVTTSIRDPDDPLGDPIVTERPATEAEREADWLKHKPVLKSAGYVSLITAKLSDRNKYNRTFAPVIRYISELAYPLDPNGSIEDAGNDENADEFNRDDLFIQLRLGKDQLIYIDDVLYDESMNDPRLPPFSLLLPPVGETVTIRVEGPDILEDQEYLWVINSEGVFDLKEIGIPEGIPLTDLVYIDPIDEEGNILVGAICRPTGAEIVNFKFFPLRDQDIIDPLNPTQELWYPIQLASSEIGIMMYRPSNNTEYDEDYRMSFPIPILRDERGWLVKNKSNPHYPSTKKLLNKLKFNIDTLSNNILKSDGFTDEDLQTAAMVPSVAVRTDNQCCMRYLFNLYNYMRNNQQLYGNIDLPVDRAYQEHLWNLDYPTNYLLDFIPEDFDGNMVDYITNGDTSGWMPGSEVNNNPLGLESVWPKKLFRPPLNEMRIDQWPYNARYAWQNITLQPNVKQSIRRKRNYYERKGFAIYKHNGDGTADIINIGSLQVKFYVQIHSGSGGDAGLDAESDFSLPLIYGVLRELPPLQQEEVVARGMYATMFSGKVVKVKRWKKYLGFIIAIVITLVTWGVGGGAGAAIGGALAGGLTAAIVINTFVTMIIKFIVGRIISFIIAKILTVLDLGFLGVVLGVIANMATGYFMAGGTGDFLSVDNIMNGVTKLGNAVNEELQRRMQELTMQTNEDIANINKATKEVEELIANYNKGTPLVKMQQFVLESPKMYEARNELDTVEAALHLDDGMDLQLYGLDYGFE